MNKQNITKAAKTIICYYEGLSLKQYVCPAGKKTIGFGHVILPNDKTGSTITKEKASELLETDIDKAISAISKQVKVTLSDNQYAALVSFVFNVGADAFSKSTLLKKINNNDIDSASKEFGKWVYANAKILPGLVKRREAERLLFLR